MNDIFVYHLDMMMPGVPLDGASFGASSLLGRGFDR
jgi:hypothetical protein